MKDVQSKRETRNNKKQTHTFTYKSLFFFFSAHIPLFFFFCKSSSIPIHLRKLVVLRIWTKTFFRTVTDVESVFFFFLLASSQFPQPSETRFTVNMVPRCGQDNPIDRPVSLKTHELVLVRDPCELDLFYFSSVAPVSLFLFPCCTFTATVRFRYAYSTVRKVRSFRIPFALFDRKKKALHVSLGIRSFRIFEIALRTAAETCSHSEIRPRVCASRALRHTALRPTDTSLFCSSLDRIPAE